MIHCKVCLVVFKVNIPNDLAANIMNSLAQSGPTRGLFHDAIFLLFPALNHFWKRYVRSLPPSLFSKCMFAFHNVNTSLQYNAISSFKNDNISDKNEVKFLFLL